MSKEFVLGIRIFLECVLLTVVWLNAHWSVALTLTLLTISNELSDWAQNIRDREAQREDKLYGVMMNEIKQSATRAAEHRL
jgi:hypothetical protein